MRDTFRLDGRPEAISYPVSVSQHGHADVVQAPDAEGATPPAILTCWGDDVSLETARRVAAALNATSLIPIEELERERANFLLFSGLRLIQNSQAQQRSDFADEE